MCPPKHTWNPDEVNTGNPLERTPCPIPAKTLQYLYEKPMHHYEIAQYIQTLTSAQKPFSYRTISRWLRIIGVTMRDKWFEISRANRNNPKKESSAHANIVIARVKYRESPNYQKSNGKAIAKARRARSRRCVRNRVRLECSNLLCTNGEDGRRKVFYRRPSLVRAKYNFCCVDCYIRLCPSIVKEARRETKLRGINQRINTPTPEMIALAQQMGIPLPGQSAI